MRLVTYDRQGTRRLGAWVDGTVVDLPDAVGHPAFPTTMEALVARNGGTLLEAARHALTRPDVAVEAAVPDARLLAPIVPSYLREFSPEARLELADAPDGPARSDGSAAEGAEVQPGSEDATHRRILGPGAPLPWPPFVIQLQCELEVACVIGKAGRNLPPHKAADLIFGYTLMGTWSARLAGRTRQSGRRPAKPLQSATSLGPCVVTAEEFDPGSLQLETRVDGEVWSEGSLDGAHPDFPRIIGAVSRIEDLAPGEVYGSGVLGYGYRLNLGHGLRPGTVVELEADGIGVLWTRVGRRGRDGLAG